MYCSRQEIYFAFQCRGIITRSRNLHKENQRHKQHYVLNTIHVRTIGSLCPVRLQRVDW